MPFTIKKIFWSMQNFLDRKNSIGYFFSLRNKLINAKSKLLKYMYHREYSKLMRKFCCEIPLGTTFNDIPNFPHGLNGIFTSKGAIIGKNCTIFQHVTIGSNTLKDSKKIGAPKIGDNVYIGAGAKIIGKITIGNNVRIGANAVVVKDVKDNCTVVMNEPRVIVHNENKDNTYYLYDEVSLL